MTRLITLTCLPRRFSNSACAGSGARNGTCYTEAECTQRGGVDAGSCAAGFGVCCVSKTQLAGLPVWMILVGQTEF